MVHGELGFGVGGEVVGQTEPKRVRSGAGRDRQRRGDASDATCRWGPAPREAAPGTGTRCRPLAGGAWGACVFVTL